jgi:hypothetical protein
LFERLWVYPNAEEVNEQSELTVPIALGKANEVGRRRSETKPAIPCGAKKQNKHEAFVERLWGYPKHLCISQNLVFKIG